MADPISVDIPHKLGLAGARARIEKGVGKLASFIPGASVTEHRWDGDILLFTVEAMGQRVASRVEVLENRIRASFDLPPMLHLFAGNPFPDATPEFFAAMSKTLSLGLAYQVAIDAPFVTMHKSDVIRLGAELHVPFELTLSCMNPRQGLHCGQCSKCRERRDAFHEAGIEDPTSYASRPLR